MHVACSLRVRDRVVRGRTVEHVPAVRSTPRRRSMDPRAPATRSVGNVLTDVDSCVIVVVSMEIDQMPSSDSGTRRSGSCVTRLWSGRWRPSWARCARRELDSGRRHGSGPRDVVAGSGRWRGGSRCHAPGDAAQHRAVAPRPVERGRVAQRTTAIGAPPTPAAARFRLVLSAGDSAGSNGRGTGAVRLPVAATSAAGPRAGCYPRGCRRGRGAVPVRPVGSDAPPTKAPP